jgi:hypothetical protein
MTRRRTIDVIPPLTSTTGTSYLYQWYRHIDRRAPMRGDFAAGMRTIPPGRIAGSIATGLRAEHVPIPGATSSTYTTSPADAGLTISYRLEAMPQ